MICRFLIGLIHVYRWFISPYLASRCRFVPTCSQYAVHCLQHHGLKDGCVYIMRRLLRCHPWEKLGENLGGSWGYDPVPSSVSLDCVPETIPEQCPEQYLGVPETKILLEQREKRVI